MKILLPLDDNKQDVCITFGRSPYFLLYEDGKETVLENPASEAEGGAGPKAAQFVVDQQADILITFRCGQNAAEVLKATNIKIYKAEGKTYQENINALQKNELSKLTHFHAGYHGVK